MPCDLFLVSPAPGGRNITANDLIGAWHVIDNPGTCDNISCTLTISAGGAAVRVIFLRSI